MEIELTIRIGDKSRGVTTTIKDWDSAPDRRIAEEALRRSMDYMYKKVVEDMIKETLDGKVYSSKATT